MKTTLLKLVAVMCMATMLYSCSSSNGIASSFGKRKYTKGHFFNNPASHDDVATRTAMAQPVATADNKTTAAEKKAEVQQSTIAATAQETKKPQVQQEQKKAVTTVAAKVASAVKPALQKNITANSNEQLSYAPTPSPEATQADRGSYNTPAILGFCLSLIGLLLHANGFAVILLVLGVIFSAMGMKKTNHRMFALLGLVMGVVGLAWWFYYFFIATGHAFNLF